MEGTNEQWKSKAAEADDTQRMRMPRRGRTADQKEYQVLPNIIDEGVSSVIIELLDPVSRVLNLVGGV